MSYLYREMLLYYYVTLLSPLVLSANNMDESTDTAMGLVQHSGSTGITVRGDVVDKHAMAPCKLNRIVPVLSS